MKKVIKYFLAFIGILIIFFTINFILSLYYYNKYQSSVNTAVNTFLNDQITGNIKGTYDFLSKERKALNPYDIYIQRIQNLNNVPKPTSCEVIYFRIDSVIGTNYIGPEAVIQVLCKMTYGEASTNQYKFIRENGEWKIPAKQ